MPAAQPTAVMAAARTGTSKAVTGATQVVSELPLGRPLVLGVLGVVAVAALIALLASQLGGAGTPAAGAATASRTPTPTVTTSTPTPQAITLKAADYVGHSATTVSKQLAALGLKTTTSTVRSSRTKGTVTSLTPLTGLHEGDTVTLRVADGVSSQPATKDQPKDKPGKGHGRGKKK